MNQPLPYQQPRGPMAWLDAAAEGLARHWLAIINSFMGAFVILPWLAPIFMAVGWTGVGGFLNRLYAGFCHQLPERSFFVAGHQVAHCHRCVFFYGTLFLAGLLYARLRPRLISYDGAGMLRYTALSIWQAVLICVPMLIDGVTHAVGLRDGGWGGDQAGSLNWWIRLLTAVPAGLAIVFAAYSRMDAGFQRTLQMNAYYKRVQQLQMQNRSRL